MFKEHQERDIKLQDKVKKSLKQKVSAYSVKEVEGVDTRKNPTYLAYVVRTPTVQLAVIFFKLRRSLTMTDRSSQKLVNRRDKQ